MHTDVHMHPHRHDQMKKFTSRGPSQLHGHGKYTSWASHRYAKKEIPKKFSNLFGWRNPGDWSTPTENEHLGKGRQWRQSAIHNRHLQQDTEADGCMGSLAVITLARCVNNSWWGVRGVRKPLGQVDNTGYSSICLCRCSVVSSVCGNRKEDTAVKQVANLWFGGTVFTDHQRLA